MLPKQGFLFNGERSKIMENGHKEKRVYFIEGDRRVDEYRKLKLKPPSPPPSKK
jgi:hypothetical protein